MNILIPNTPENSLISVKKFTEKAKVNYLCKAIQHESKDEVLAFKINFNIFIAFLLQNVSRVNDNIFFVIVYVSSNSTKCVSKNKNVIFEKKNDKLLKFFAAFPTIYVCYVMKYVLKVNLCLSMNTLV